MAKYNYPGANPPRVQIKFNKLDNTNAQMLQVILQALIGKDEIKFDVEQLGEMAGLTITEVQETIAPSTDPAVKPGNPKNPAPTPAKKSQTNSQVIEVQNAILTRVVGQVENAFRDKRFDQNFTVNLGFKRRMEAALSDIGIINSAERTNRLYDKLDIWSRDVADLGTSYITNSAEFAARFSEVLNSEVLQAVNAS